MKTALIIVNRKTIFLVDYACHVDYIDYEHDNRQDNAHIRRRINLLIDQPINFASQEEKDADGYDQNDDTGSE